MQTERTRRATEAALRAEAERGELSLYAFVKLAWRILEPDTAFVDGWHIEAVCRHLGAITDGKITRLLINIPPGSSKSLIVSVFWPAWEWGPKNQPHLRYLSTSYKEGYVTRDTRRTRDLVMSEWYQRLWGARVQLTRTGETSFENTARGNREGSTFNSLTGGRGDRVICLPFNEPILTDHGWLPIGRVVEQRLAVKVAGTDGAKITWQEIDAYERNPTRSLVRIVFDGCALTCTHDHLVYIDGRGWVAAGGVQAGEAARTVDDNELQSMRAAEGSCGNAEAPVLQPGLLHGRATEAREGGQYQAVPHMRRPCLQDASAPRPDKGRAVLQRGLYGRVHPRSEQSSVSRRPRGQGLREMWKEILREAGRSAPPQVLLAAVRFTYGVGSKWTNGQCQALRELWEGIQAAKLCRLDVFSIMRRGNPRAPRQRRGERPIYPRSACSTVSAGVVPNIQGENPRARRERLPSVCDGASPRSVGAAHSPYRLREGEFGAGKPDNGLPILPRDDARRSRPACGMVRKVVRAVEVVANPEPYTYNVRVGPHSNYFASGVLVHNCDDPHSVDSAESELERAAVTRRFRESVPSRVNDPIRSAIVIIMQRLHEADVSGVIAQLKLPYTHLMIPMEFEADRACVTFVDGKEFWRDPRTVDGELMCPERWPRAVIEQEKINQGPYAWAGQYQQRPAPRGGAMIKEAWLQWYDKPPPRHTLKVYITSDYAVEEGRGDYTVHGVFGVDPFDRIYVLDWWRGQTTPLKWVDELFRLVKKWEPALVGEESGQIIKSIGPVIQKMQREQQTYFSRRRFVSHQKKDVRAQGIRARIESGMVFLPVFDPQRPNEYAWVTELVYELVRFPAVAHDDQTDCFSLLGRMLNALSKGEQEEAPEPPLVVGPNTYTMDQLIKMQPKGSSRI